MLERGRVVGRPRRVGQLPVVRLLRVGRPRIGALARKPRHRRAVDLERTRRRPAPGRIVGDGFRRLRDARPRARIERNRRSRLRRRHGFYRAERETINARSRIRCTPNSISRTNRNPPGSYRICGRTPQINRVDFIGRCTIAISHRRNEYTVASIETFAYNCITNHPIVGRPVP